MAQEKPSDGNTSWSGGFDTSRNPIDIGKNQYSKAVNVIIPASNGGLSCRYGYRNIPLKFKSKKDKEIYESGSVQGEGWFSSDSEIYLLLLVDGYLFKFTSSGIYKFIGEIINFNDKNSKKAKNAWITKVPNGCIVNNGIDLPFYVTKNSIRRTNPDKGEIGIGRMGVYVQNRFFYVDSTSKRVLASDAFVPYRFSLEGTGIVGFQCPDQDEEITALAKQKTILGSVEGGNLIWSSSKDIYSVDVRGPRATWGDLGSKTGKVTETIPGFSACSSYSFEAFNTNIYFRSNQYGMCDVKQSQYQYVNMDSVNNQAIEASYYLNNDTEWMLEKCYTKACNNRLFTTVAPELDSNASIYWNGILSFNPEATYTNGNSNTRRFESVFTGIRPWCLTVVNFNSEKDKMYIHSKDSDDVNRLYLMDEDINYDIDNNGVISEIEGYIETRAYDFENRFLLKKIDKRFYRLSRVDRSLNIKVFSRPETFGPWIQFWNTDHLVCRTKIENGVFTPIDSHPQTRSFVLMSNEEFGDCYSGNSIIAIQYRIEFKGPINLDMLVLGSALENYSSTVHSQETECITLEYKSRKDYNYSIIKDYERN